MNAYVYKEGHMLALYDMRGRLLWENPSSGCIVMQCWLSYHAAKELRPDNVTLIKYSTLLKRLYGLE